MISEALSFIKDQLNTALKAHLFIGDVGSESEKDLVEFVSGEKQDPLIFSTGVVSMMLVGIEQEKVMRRAEPFRTISTNGTPQYINPEIRLQATILLVSQFKQYDVGLRAISEIIYFFQENSLYLQGENSALPAIFDRLSIELVTSAVAEQNEIWSSLRAAYRPSLLYKVGMLVFKDKNPANAPQVTETKTVTKQRMQPKEGKSL